MHAREQARSKSIPSASPCTVRASIFCSGSVASKRASQLCFRILNPLVLQLPHSRCFSSGIHVSHDEPTFAAPVTRGVQVCQLTLNQVSFLTVRNVVLSDKPPPEAAATARPDCGTTHHSITAILALTGLAYLTVSTADVPHFSPTVLLIVAGPSHDLPLFFVCSGASYPQPNPTLSTRCDLSAWPDIPRNGFHLVKAGDAKFFFFHERCLGPLLQRRHLFLV